MRMSGMSMMGPSRKRPGIATFAGLSAAGAVACAVCCIAPLALPAAMLASVGGVLAWVGRLYLAASFIAAGLVLAAWTWIGLVKVRTGSWPARSTLVIASAATLAAMLAWAWPLLEDGVVQVLRSQR